VTYSVVFMRAEVQQLKEITSLVESGAIRPVIDRAFPFQETGSALAYVESDGPRARLW
jgi:NADPH:quinone reductase-like Zn-dependent oxidoreductase